MFGKHHPEQCAPDTQMDARESKTKLKLKQEKGRHDKTILVNTTNGRFYYQY